MEAQDTKHVTYKLACHFVWCPKYRRRILTGKIVTFVEEEFRRFCEGNTWTIGAMSTLDAVGSVLDEDGKGGYRFDRMTFNGPFDILGFFLGYRSGQIMAESPEERQERVNDLPTEWGGL
jgi:Transposase IS200 like